MKPTKGTDTKNVCVEFDDKWGSGRWLRVKTVRVPTWRGWLILAVLAFGLSTTAAFSIHPFLAVTDSVGEGFLVVEGWLHDDAIADVLNVFANGDYAGILTTGGPLSRGTLLSEYENFAKLSAATLLKAGVPPEKLHPVPAPAVTRDRTYASALAVREWLDNHVLSISRLDVLSKGVHARRSRLLFQAALGEKVAVGVIALPSAVYDADTWWRTSAGFRAVIGESLAYLYVKVAFRKPRSGTR